jgi:ABC-type phosphate transport system substrate-binding protein
MKTYLRFILQIVLSIMLISCESNDKQSDSTIESPLRGSDTVYCDESIFTCINNAMPIYQKAFPDAHITLFSKNARSSMAELFSEKTKSIIVARNYLSDEDSLLKQSGYSFQKIHIANDGLVFFVSKEFPIDTLNINQLTEYISGKNRLSFYFPKLNSEPLLLIPGAQSSEYANSISFFPQISKTAKDIAKFNNSKDSIVFEVLKGKSIGLGYLSYIQKNPLLKSLRIGYLDSLGNRIPPQIVHQGFIIQKKYPFEIPIIAYLREKRQNLPWGFATFIEKDPNIQKVLLDCGLIPVFAKYNLIQED